MTQPKCEHRMLTRPGTCGATASWLVSREFRKSDAQSSCGRHLHATVTALEEGDGTRIVVQAVTKASGEQPQKPVIVDPFLLAGPSGHRELMAGRVDSQKLQAMTSPVLCAHCRKAYDLGSVKVLQHYQDCDVFRAPCCGRSGDTRNDPRHYTELVRTETGWRMR